jgi:predicted peptidase
MGCMTSMALNIAHPNMFGGTLCVAGQWDETKLAPVARQNLFYIVSEGDFKASPGMDAFEKVAVAAGKTPAKAVWDARWPQDKFASSLAELVGKNGSLILVKFKAGTAPPPGAAGMAEHIFTWDKAYPITALREWLFKQRRKAS